ncbi:MAG: DNA polymerase IV [Candidatus Woesearchaeota archaeon]|nr:DNA polymerase IV [Candidatus Woesearchaeota archaeon]
MSKIILHVDMDCFFAAVEVREHPEWKGKPVIIGADPREGKGRGVVSTCSMEARAFGIHSAMPISKAYKLCPDGIYVHHNFASYRQVSQNVMEILRSYSDVFQQTSVDEAFLDITEQVRDFEEAKLLAQKIKNEILEKEGITCSIGVSVNKLIAKMGSEHEKPDGLTIIPDKMQEFLAPKKIRELYGVGPKMEQKLQKLGISTIGDLALFNRELLTSRFGVYGAYLHLKAHGVGNDVVAPREGRKSISKERTFFHDTDDWSLIHEKIAELAERVTEKLHKESYYYKTVSVKVRLADFSTFTRATTVGRRNDLATVRRWARILSNEFHGKKIRLVGVRVAGLERLEGQRTLLAF